LQQQQQQQQLNSPYQLSLAQAAFPYQQAQFNAGITGALVAPRWSYVEPTLAFSPATSSKRSTGSRFRAWRNLGRPCGEPVNPCCF
jgi:hypothetical protein